MRSHVDRFNEPQLRGQHFRRYHQAGAKWRELLDRAAKRRGDRGKLHEPLIVRLNKENWRNG